MNQIIEINKYYLINWEVYLNNENKKIKDFLKYLREDNKFIFINDTIENIKLFIEKNKSKKYILIFPIYSMDKKQVSSLNKFFSFLKNKIKNETEIVKYINTIEKLEIKILWSLEDIYNGLEERTILNRYLYDCNHINLLGGPQNFIFKDYIFTSGEQNNLNLQNKKNLLNRYTNFQSFYCYHNIYNKNPNNKIILSGKINKAYPERQKLLTLRNSNVASLQYNYNIRFKNKYNEYVDFLSKFICGFVSGATVPRYRYGIVHKIYEVLSAGCLLLCPISHEELLKNIGLIKNVNYLCINLNQEPDKTINFICNEKNRNVINNIRKKGHELAKNVFTPENKYKEFLNIIETKLR